MFNNNHTLNCLFRSHTIILLPRFGRHMLRFALTAGKEPLAIYRSSPMSPIIPRQGSKSRTIVRGIKSGALRTIIGSVDGRLRTTKKVKMYFSTRISALAVLCLEFLLAFDLPESLYSLGCRV